MGGNGTLNGYGWFKKSGKSRGIASDFGLRFLSEERKTKKKKNKKRTLFT